MDKLLVGKLFPVLADRPTPEVMHSYDAIARVARSLICGSNRHLYHGLVPDTRVVMTFGHEFTGVVEEVGSEVQNLKVGDRVLVPFDNLYIHRDRQVEKARQDNRSSPAPCIFFAF